MKNYPVLFLITNLHKTLWYKVSDTYRMDKLAEYGAEKEGFSDHESYLQTRGKTVSGGGDVKNKEREYEKQQYLDTIAEQTKQILSQKKFHFLIYAAPERIKNELNEALKQELNGIEHKFVAGNFVNMPYEKQQELFKENLRVV